MSNNHPTGPAHHLDGLVSGFMTPEKVQALDFRELLNKPSTVQAWAKPCTASCTPAAAMG